MAWRIFMTPVAFLLTANVAVGRDASCILPSQKPIIVAELFFGRDIRGRGPVSDVEWSGFVARVIAKQFPEGFTVHDGDGEWLDPASHNVIRERTKILTVAAAPSADLPARLQIVADSYKRQFHQTSVGVITSAACGAF
jgi:hypothetical protein